MQYCLEIWGNTTKKNIDMITKMQKRIIRNTFKIKYLDHTNNCFLENDLLKFEELIKVSNAFVGYKIKNDIYKNFDNEAKIEIRKSKRKNNVTVNYARTSIIKSHLYFTAAMHFNSLPKEIQCSINSKAFKKIVKIYYSKKYLDL